VLHPGLMIPDCQWIGTQGCLLAQLNEGYKDVSGLGPAPRWSGGAFSRHYAGEVREHFNEGYIRDDRLSVAGQAYRDTWPAYN
jgi:hypothetical protein